MTGYYKKKWMAAGPFGLDFDYIIENLVPPFSKLPVLPAGSRAEGPIRRWLDSYKFHTSTAAGRERPV